MWILAAKQHHVDRLLLFKYDFIVSVYHFSNIIVTVLKCHKFNNYKKLVTTDVMVTYEYTQVRVFFTFSNWGELFPP